VRNRIAGFFFAAVTLLAQSVPRTSDGKPDLQGIWMSRNAAGFDVTEIAEGHEIPYLPEALEREQKGPRVDPIAHCAMPGVPRITYMPFPIQILQRPGYVVFMYEYMHDQRIVKTTPRDHLDGIDLWLGDSVGHWEGETLVIDTVGIEVNPYTSVDRFGTPQSEQMHVIERYRLIDGAVAKAQIDRYEQSEGTVGGGNRIAYYDPDISKKGLELDVMMEDPKVFTQPLTARVTYRRVTSEWSEEVCADNPVDHYKDEWIGLPRAGHPDF